MSIVRIAMNRLNRHYPVVAGSAHGRDFAAELVFLMRFAFRYAFHFRGVNAVQLVLVIAPLVIQS